MKYCLISTKSFKRQYKKICRSGNAKIKEALDNAVNKLVSGIVLEEKYYNHKLSGQMHDKFECHVLPDLLLIYKKDDDILVLELIATGSHSELF